MKKSWLARVGLTMAMVASVLVVAPQHAAPLGPVTTFSGSAVSTPTDIVAGPDGAMWFTNASTSEPGTIGRISPSGTVTEYGYTVPPFGATARPLDITVGGDGNLWFTNSAHLAGRIGRITPAGTVTLFSTGQLYEPRSIAAGPDGNLWFTTFVTNAVSKMDTDGVVIATYTIGAGFHGPTAITPGPDGNMWFTNTVGHSIGRITPSGVITTFTGSGISSPDDIVAGSDGRLWFTNGAGVSNEGSIGAIDTTGAITNYAFGYDTVRYPTGITAGPDGALWFSNKSVLGSIGRITTTGAVRYYDLGFDVDAHHLAFDGAPDPALYFTYPGINRVYRTELVLGVNTTSAPSGQVAIPYSKALVAADGTAPYSWDLQSGSLPPGLTLTAGGTITGTPTTVGTFPFVARVTDSDVPAATATRALSITIGPAPFRITTTSLPNATLGVPYAKELTAASGIPPYKWKKLTKLPKGLKLNAKTGVISGTPKKFTGTFTVTVQARYRTTIPKPAAWHYATKTFSLVVN